MKIFVFLSLKLLLRFIINGKTFPRNVNHMCVGVHVCMCVCMYVEGMCVHTCKSMHVCACIYGASAMIQMKGFLCTNSSWAVTERLYKSFPNATQPLNTKYK